MRIDVEKYLVVGSTSSKDAFFTRVQELGIMEFIHKGPTSMEAPTQIQTFVDALHVLRQMVPVKQVPVKDYRSANVLARHVVERNHELEHLREKARILEKEISRIEVFGDFSLSMIQEIEKESGRVIQFFFAKKSETLEAPKRPEVIFIDQAYGLDYFVAINKEPTQYPGFVEILIEHSLSELHVQLAEVNRKVDMYETELASLAHKKKLLKNGLLNTLNRYHLEESKESVQNLIDGEAFAVEAWIPKNKVSLLKQISNGLHLYMTPILVEKEDRVPTYLENKRFGRLGEDLINIYDTPSKEDRDPSLWVFIAFGIFFSMIVADAGYGLVILGISIWLYLKYGKKMGGMMRRFSFLCMSLSVGCIIWGAMVTSFFGIEVTPNNPLRKVSVINWGVHQKAAYFLDKKPASYHSLVEEYPELKEATTPDAFLKSVVREQDGHKKYVIYDKFQDNLLIELTIFVGTVHLMLSFLRYLDRSWSGIGWIAFLVGSYLYFPSVLAAISLIHYVFHVPYEAGAFWGEYILFGGLGLVVVLALIQKRLSGLGEIMNVIGVFADVMSYLRIYALSLAGMIMAATFNKIGTSMPLIIGIFIILLGHLVNITLALMGGVIHGLRLNFIEWYHYSFEGGGKHFNPLKLFKIE